MNRYQAKALLLVGFAIWVGRQTEQLIINARQELGGDPVHQEGEWEAVT